MPTNTHAILLWNWITNIQRWVQWSTSKILFKGFLCLAYNIYALSPCNNSLSSIRMWAAVKGRGLVYVSCLNIKLHLKNSPPCHRCQCQTSSPSLTCRQGNESGCSVSPIHQPWQATFAWFRSDGVPVTAGGRAYFCCRWRNYCVCSAVKWLVSGVSFGWVLNGISCPHLTNTSRGQIQRYMFYMAFEDILLRVNVFEWKVLKKYVL